MANSNIEYLFVEVKWDRDVFWLTYDIDKTATRASKRKLDVESGTGEKMKPRRADAAMLALPRNDAILQPSPSNPTSAVLQQFYPVWRDNHATITGTTFGARAGSTPCAGFH